MTDAGFSPDSPMVSQPPNPSAQPLGYLDRYAGQMEGIGQDQQKAYGDYQSALAKPMSALSRANAAPIPAPPQQEKLPDAPHANANNKDALAFASAMAVLGAVASRFARVPGQVALSAFAGAMKGWQEGNREAYEASAHEWEQNTKKTIENNRMVLDKYKEVLANRKMNIDQQMSQIQLLAAQYQDRMTYDAAAAKNYTMVAQIYEKSHEATEKAQQAFQSLQEKRNADQLRYGGTTTMSPETRRRIAEQVLAGDSTARQNIGRGIQGAADIRAVNEAITQVATERGMSGADIAQAQAEFQGLKAGERALALKQANIETAVREADNMIPLALAASDASKRSGLVTWNKATQRYDAETGDPNYARFVAATNSLINIYGRAISGGGKGTVSDLEHAREILNPAMPPAAYKAAIEQMQAEMQAALKSPGQVRQDMRDRGGGEGVIPKNDVPASPTEDGWIVKER
jgi:hypothetical protein